MGFWLSLYAHTWQRMSCDGGFGICENGLCIWDGGFGILDIGYGILDLVCGPVSMECGVLVELVRPHLATDVS